MNTHASVRSLRALLLIVFVSAVSIAQGIRPGDALPLSGRSLNDAQGGQHSLGSVSGESGLVVLFWANSCPWIDRYDERVNALISAFRSRGIGFVLVNSNDAVAFPTESGQQLAQQASKAGYGVPYLIDQDAAVARAFGAQRAPEVFVFDRGSKLVYMGAIDDSPAVASQVATPHLNNALETLLAGGTVSPASTNAIGCTIKFP